MTNPVHSTPWAIQLGSLTQNLNGLASIRQLVTVPVGYSQATLGVWVYTQTQPGAGADYQQVALLNSSGTPVFVPWQAQSNNPAWTQLLFDVSAFAGQNVFVSFSVNNDGAGGRTAMVVDDVRLLSCNATPGPTSTPTRTATPGIPPTTVTAIPPIITLTPFPPGCIDLLQNGGFETGWSPWIVPYNPIMPQIVTTPVFSGAFSLQLGSQTQNASSYSSARQWVTIPWSHPGVVLQFWANTWAQSLTGDDRQQVVLLAPGDTVMAVPWKVLENTRTWLPHSFRPDRRGRPDVRRLLQRHQRWGRRQNGDVRGRCSPVGLHIRRLSTADAHAVSSRCSRSPPMPLFSPPSPRSNLWQPRARSQAWRLYRSNPLWARSPPGRRPSSR